MDVAAWLRDLGLDRYLSAFRDNDIDAEVLPKLTAEDLIRRIAAFSEDHRMDIAAWLQDLGLERYVPAFRDNDIDAEVLPKLTAEDLISIGVTSVGHRRKLLDAIASLGMAVPTAVMARARPWCTGTSRRRTPAANGDVLRSRRLDRALDPS